MSVTTAVRRPRERLTLAQARRVALAAQGFGRPQPTRPTMRDVQATVDRLAQFQIDSINIVARAHYLPLFSRLGPYDTELLHRAAQRPPRRLFEYWGHEASLIDVRLQPALRWRMAAAAEDAWGRMKRIRAEQPGLVDAVRAEIADQGPLTARQIEYEEERRTDHWGWNWSSVKTCLEWLFWSGEITAAGRNRQFERLYDLPERVLPAQILAQPTPSQEEADVILIRRAAQALGIGTTRCLGDYFRIPAGRARVAIAALAESGELLPVAVPGWTDKGGVHLWHNARIPRRIEARALLSPFDSMVFERQRLERLFHFRYRIEIYVPAERRVHGYYVYPFLLDEAMVARVDLKADRASGVLRVNSAWLEEGADPAEVSEALAGELTVMAGWLGLNDVVVSPCGDLGPRLAAAQQERPTIGGASDAGA
ncbi:winged helix-turn-helix domain-containing protein [Microlunatus phosphovorus]|uniref:winged helix-turn-helix domain-containing protein n=1 Tax=Microlunatus phosphovorus TaxID=29405 RepID=UPI00059F3CFD|nr:crosslink repair DNA glycosylase YcaQ family protein [Microlunatus phosphovorus]